MSRKSFLLLACLFLMAFSWAQDQLYKKDNSKLLVKVLEIGSSEIKYKLFDNLNGPIYTELKSSISLIIYENGKHEVVSNEPQSSVANYPRYLNDSRKSDSLKYYSRTNSVSLNFLNFFNNEIGVIYQKEIFESNYNIIVPIAFGLEQPNVTQSVWYSQGNNESYIDLEKKRFELGLGIHYYPNLGTNINYFIGPVFRFMQFDAVQNYYANYSSVKKNIVLNRYAMTITNGFIFRTKSRLVSTLFASLGFKYDKVPDPVIDPVTNIQSNPISQPVSLNIWLGYSVGFNF